MLKVFRDNRSFIPKYFPVNSPYTLHINAKQMAAIRKALSRSYGSGFIFLRCYYWGDRAVTFCHWSSFFVRYSVKISEGHLHGKGKKLHFETRALFLCWTVHSRIRLHLHSVDALCRAFLMTCIGYIIELN